MKPKVIAMIPARYGSQRVKKKNLRLLDGQPLISYVVENAVFANCFDEIYINSEHPIFGKIAEEKGVKFYQRDPQFSTDKSTNDEFGLDFIKNTDGDILIQILPTSPFLSPEEIRAFTEKMVKEKLDSLISVEHKQIACVYGKENRELNFSKTEPNPPSQLMEPVKAYATALMGWTYSSFAKNMEDLGCAYHGGRGNTDYYELRGLSTIDIDREEDFLLAEKVMKALKTESSAGEIQYYDEGSFDHSETHVESILARDGVEQNDLYDVNREIINVSEIFEKMDSSTSWSKRVIDTESNSMTIISQLPGEGNRLHYHPNWNEWWYILDGEWTWTIEGEEKTVKKGDIVFMRKNRPHKITAAGTGPAVRMAVSRADVAHVYPKGE